MKYFKNNYLFLSVSLHLLLLVLFCVYFDFFTYEKKYGNTSMAAISTFLYRDSFQQATNHNTQNKSQIKSLKSQPYKDKSAIALSKEIITESQQYKTSSKKGGEQQGEAVAEFLVLLHDAIQQKQQYPESALEMQRQGRVTVIFVLHEDGHISNLRLSKSSGTTSLDMAAFKAVEEAAPFTRLLDYIKKAQEYQIDIVFELS